jgi:hypothetical protein
VLFVSLAKRSIAAGRIFMNLLTTNLKKYIVFGLLLTPTLTPMQQQMLQYQYLKHRSNGSSSGYNQQQQQQYNQQQQQQYNQQQQQQYNQNTQQKTSPTREPVELYAVISINDEIKVVSKLEVKNEQKKLDEEFKQELKRYQDDKKDSKNHDSSSLKKPDKKDFTLKTLKATFKTREEAQKYADDVIQKKSKSGTKKTTANNKS